MEEFLRLQRERIKEVLPVDPFEREEKARVRRERRQQIKTCGRLTQRECWIEKGEHEKKQQQFKRAARRRRERVESARTAEENGLKWAVGVPKKHVTYCWTKNEGSSEGRGFLGNEKQRLQLEEQAKRRVAAGKPRKRLKLQGGLATNKEKQQEGSDRLCHRQGSNFRRFISTTLQGGSRVRVSPGGVYGQVLPEEFQSADAGIIPFLKKGRRFKVQLDDASVVSADGRDLNRLDSFESEYVERLHRDTVRARSRKRVAQRAQRLADAMRHDTQLAFYAYRSADLSFLRFKVDQSMFGASQMKDDLRVEAFVRQVRADWRQLVASARRFAAAVVQRHVRGHAWRKLVRRAKQAMPRLQACARGALARSARAKFRKGVLRLQAVSRRRAVKGVVRQKRTELASAIALQSRARGLVHRLRAARAKKGMERLQAVSRRRAANMLTKVMEMERKGARTLQCCVRSLFARLLADKMREEQANVIDAMSRSSARELRKAGMSATKVARAGFSAAEMTAAGYSARECRQAGYPVNEMWEAGHTASALVWAGYRPAELKAGGFDAADLLGSSDARREEAIHKRWTNARRATRYLEDPEPAMAPARRKHADLGSFSLDATAAIISVPGGVGRTLSTRVRVARPGGMLAEDLFGEVTREREHFADDAQGESEWEEGVAPMLVPGTQYRVEVDGGSIVRVDGAELQYEGPGLYEQWSAIVKECQRETDHMTVRLDGVRPTNVAAADAKKLSAEERELLEDEAAYQAVIPGIQTTGAVVLQGREVKRHPSYSFACVWMAARKRKVVPGTATLAASRWEDKTRVMGLAKLTDELGQPLMKALQADQKTSRPEMQRGRRGGLYPVMTVRDKIKQKTREMAVRDPEYLQRKSEEYAERVQKERQEKAEQLAKKVAIKMLRRLRQRQRAREEAKFWRRAGFAAERAAAAAVTAATFADCVCRRPIVSFYVERRRVEAKGCRAQPTARERAQRGRERMHKYIVRRQEKQVWESQIYFTGKTGQDRAKRLKRLRLLEQTHGHLREDTQSKAR
eukprot:g1415.t1